jgi:dynein heavy chain
VTPTSYLELLGTLVRLLAEKRAELAAARRRLEAGLDKLTASAAQVVLMQKELRELQPVLARTAQEVRRRFLAWRQGGGPPAALRLLRRHLHRAHVRLPCV